MTCSIFDFPPFDFVFYPTLFTCLIGSGIVCGMTSGMQCVSFNSFSPDLFQNQKPIPDALTVFVALTPTQFAQLSSDQPVLPDPYSGRFGLRTDQLKAVERASIFMNWRAGEENVPQDAPVHPKRFVVCCLKITHLGYFTLMEDGIIEKGDGSNHYREGHYRWNGPLFKERVVIRNGKEELLFRISDEFIQIV